MSLFGPSKEQRARDLLARVDRVNTLLAQMREQYPKQMPNELFTEWDTTRAFVEQKANRQLPLNVVTGAAPSITPKQQQQPSMMALARTNEPAVGPLLTEMPQAKPDTMQMTVAPTDASMVDPRVQFDPAALSKNPIGFIEQLGREWGTPEAVFQKLPIAGGLIGLEQASNVMNAITRLKANDYEMQAKQGTSMASSAPRGMGRGLADPMYFVNDALKTKQEDTRVISDMILRAAETQERGYTLGGKVAQGLSALPTYMIEFMLTGGLANMGEKAVQDAGLKLLKGYATTKAGQAALKAAGWAGGAITRTTLGIAPRIAEDAAQRQAEVMTGIRQSETPFMSFAKAWGDNVIEMASETTGEAITKGLKAPIKALMSKTTFGQKFLDSLKNSWIARTGGTEASFFNKLAKAGGYSSIIGEIGEERLGTILRAITEVDDFGAGEDADVWQRLEAAFKQDFSEQNIISEAIVLSVPGAAKKVGNIVDSKLSTPSTGPQQKPSDQPGPSQAQEQPGPQPQAGPGKQQAPQPQAITGTEKAALPGEKAQPLVGLSKERQIIAASRIAKKLTQGVELQPTEQKFYDRYRQMVDAQRERLARAAQSIKTSEPPYIPEGVEPPVVSQKPAAGESQQALPSTSETQGVDTKPKSSDTGMGSGRIHNFKPDFISNFSDQNTWEDKASVTPGVSFHNRSDGKKPSETGNIVLFADDPNENDHYGEQRYAIDTSNLPEIPQWVVDYTVEYSKKNNADFWEDAKESHGWTDDELNDKIESDTEKGINPDRIVNSAGWWDDQNFVNDFWQDNEDRLIKEGLYGFKTNDGAVIFDPENAPIISQKDAKKLASEQQPEKPVTRPEGKVKEPWEKKTRGTAMADAGGEYADINNPNVEPQKAAPSGMTGEDFELRPEMASPYRAVAMLWKGKILEGKPGDNHATIAEKHGFPTDMIPGFVTKEGKFHYQYSEDIPSSQGLNIKADALGSLQRVNQSQGVSEKIVRKSEISAKIEKILGEPIRTGKVTEGGRASLGMRKRDVGVIRTRAANDIETITHEAAHAIQEEIFGTIKPNETGFSFGNDAEKFKIVRELKDLDYDRDKRRTSEGFAEFVRHYVNGEKEAKSRAPIFYDVFESHMDKNYPSLLKMLKETRTEWGKWLEQSDVTQVLSQISKSEKKTPPSLDNIYTTVLDDLHPIQQAVDAIYQDRPLATSKNPYILGRNMRGWFGRAHHFIYHGTLDKNNQMNGEGLQEILKDVPAKRLDDFRAYLTAKRAIELSQRFPEKDMEELTGFTERAAQGTVWKFESEFSDVAKRLYQYQDRLLEYARDNGLVDAETFKKIKSVNEFYVPFYRVMGEDIFKAKGISGKKLAGAKSPIKRIKGSGREIIDPLEGILKNTFSIINLSGRNRVMNALADLSKEPNSGRWIEKVPVPISATRVTLEELAKALGDKNVDFESTEEAFVNIFRPSHLPAEPNHVYVLRDGKREYYRLEPELYKAVNAIDENSANWLIKLLSTPAKALRAGATLVPEFAGRNVFRDQISAYIQSKYGFKPGIDFARGMFHLIGKDDMYWKFKASGADNAMLTSLDRNYLQQSVNDIVRSKLSRFIRWGRNPLNILRDISEISEISTRLGEFSRGIKKEGDGIEGLDRSAYAAREVTLDFPRGGKSIFRQINRVNAFFNAQLQGVDKLIRTAKENPAKFTFRAITAITLPSIALWLINHDDERYKNIPRWQKDFFWLIPIKNGFIRIPKPFELGLLFGSLPERILDYAFEHDKEGMAEWVKSGKDALLPELVPTAAKPLIENVANKNFFFDSPIVPQYLIDQGIEKKYQYKDNTSETAKLIGELINESPAKVENLFRGYFAGLGRYITNASDWGVVLLKGEKRPSKPEEGLAGWPLLRGFAVKYPSSNLRSIERFWDEWEKVKTARNTYRFLDKSDKTKAEKYYEKNRDLIEMYPDMEDLKQEVSSINKEIASIHNDQKMAGKEKRIQIEKLYLDLIDLTRENPGNGETKQR